MDKILIVFASKQGQTQKIAEAVSAHLRKCNYLVDLCSIDEAPHDIREYGSVIVGASVHAEGYSSKLRKWIVSQKTNFELKPSAFYSVCLGILQDSPEVKHQEEKIVENLFNETGWYPDISTIFAGALMYSKYNWFLKRVMHGIAKKAGFETDMTKDYEYTDWNEVVKFANRFNSLIQPITSHPLDGLYVYKKNS